MCRLNGYLAKIGVVETDICKCGRESETVDDFLFRCPQWLEHRQTLFDLARKVNRWGDLSFALGGWSNKRKDETLQSWNPSQERAGRSADGDEDLQNSSAEESHDI